MNISDLLATEWKPALGCTEPAAVAWVTALAMEHTKGEIRSVELLCDPRTYKNCYAVGIPNSGHCTGILWALALGVAVKNSSLGLKIFDGNSADAIAMAKELIEHRKISVEVATGHPELMVCVTVEADGGTAIAMVEREHTNLTRLEANGVIISGKSESSQQECATEVRSKLVKLSHEERREMARSLMPSDRNRLREGINLNLAIAEHGLALLPKEFAFSGDNQPQARISRLVAAGVFARMSGEALPVMTLSGSGNKGITVTVPIVLWGREIGAETATIEEALAFACIMTSAVTYELGTLSAICGAANAAGIGVAVALVLLAGGNSEQIDLAINNMVGNLAGMICDGAKIGCAMKTMTGVDAAFRATQLAMAGIGIPATDGIVGENGATSLANLGTLARQGMKNVDETVLQIMQGKLKR
ncbi:MAG: L-serine ammonia-lyase, iron-sulfur-dependent, subunit alpha [Holophagaceae bacterium]|nr:L-serine ammonia-lyase, iron-sulfur-dependent, subunit alpha [Holophagaceae bacterium]